MISKPATLTTASGAPVVLRSVKAVGRLSGLLLTMTLRQTFRNDEAAHIEVTYTFPLPWGAVLTGLEATLGDKRMSGQVMARQQAAQRYEKAVEQGDAPVMVEKNRDGSFTASLGSLKPGEEATVELRYAQALNFEQGRVRLVVPTTIAPRYGDPVSDGGLLPHQAAQPELLAEHAFGLELTLTGLLAQAQLSCPSHRVTQQVVQDGVHIATTGAAWLDRDFVMLMEGLEGQSLAVAGPDPAAGEGHCAVIASFCPQRASRPEAPLSLKILVDCSGSMGGDSIQQARVALRALAAGMKSEDRFSYSRFGSAPQLGLSARQASAQGLQELHAAIDRTDADLGGTEMGAAFEHVFDLSLPQAPGAPEADVLVITDGAVWGVQDLLARTRRSGHRVYALGVGSAPAESLLSEVAQDTGGACEFVTPNEDMVAAMRRLLSRMRVASAIDMTLEVAPAPLWCSPLPRRMAEDETVHAHLRLPARPGASPRLRFDDQAVAPAEITWLPDDLVARIVAARQISHTAVETDAAEIAVRYQLVTDHTNLLLVFQRVEAEKTDGMPALRKVRPMMAAGAGAVGSVLSSAAYSMRALRTGSEFPAMSMDSISVWRNARSKVEALASNGLDEIDIPAFLRNHGDGPGINALRRMRSSADRLGTVRESTPAWAALAGRQAAFDIVSAFNDAVRPGLSFRHVLQAVTQRTLDPQITASIEQATAVTGTRVKAWACFLMWVHQLNAPQARLSDAALELVLAQLRQVDAQQQEAGTAIFQAIPQ
jgi:Ca-activated chloride channel family protein